LRIGGAAALYLEPESEADLVAVTSMLREAPVPIVVIGKGSNILVSDDGFEGLVLRLGRSYRWAAREGDRIRAGGSMPLPALAGVALAHGLAGLEWGVAIPASFGGAVRMNAGAHGGDMAEIVETIDVLDLATGASLAVPSAEAGFRYRVTELPSAGVVTGATIALSPGEPSAIRTRMDEIREWRREHQPLAEPNCGSVFKNPPGDFAARLVDEAGCKGMTLGGASVSVKHANFIVASPGTRADDVLELIRSVQRVVVERFDVRLEPEVHLVGRFDRTPS
jgi:UDP-N-acetylmuramate dehydrogenase